MTYVTKGKYNVNCDVIRYLHPNANVATLEHPSKMTSVLKIVKEKKERVKKLWTVVRVQYYTYRSCDERKIRTFVADPVSEEMRSYAHLDGHVISAATFLACHYVLWDAARTTFWIWSAFCRHGTCAIVLQVELEKR